MGRDAHRLTLVGLPGGVLVPLFPSNICFSLFPCYHLYSELVTCFSSVRTLPGPPPPPQHPLLLSRAALARLLETPPNGELARRLSLTLRLNPPLYAQCFIISCIIIVSADLKIPEKY